MRKRAKTMAQSVRRRYNCHHTEIAKERAFSRGQERKMAYTAEISRTNPTCFLFLFDQSSSMLEPFGRQPEKQKAEGVADAINRLFQNLVLKCAKSEGIRDYFYVGAIVYGGQVASALGGNLAGQHLVPDRKSPRLKPS